MSIYNNFQYFNIDLINAMENIRHDYFKLWGFWLPARTRKKTKHSNWYNLDNVKWLMQKLFKWKKNENENENVAQWIWAEATIGFKECYTKIALATILATSKVSQQ